MTEFCAQDIISHRFETRRRGYDTMAVDDYLERIAEHVGRMQEELAKRQATERTALDLLQKAQRIADDTRVGAMIDANRDRETGARELEQARTDAAAMLEQSRAEALRVMHEAEVDAQTIIANANQRAAEVSQAAVHHSAELEETIGRMSEFINSSAADLRLGASRLMELADHFQFEMTARSEVIDLRDDVVSEQQ